MIGLKSFFSKYQKLSVSIVLFVAVGTGFFIWFINSINQLESVEFSSEQMTLEIGDTYQLTWQTVPEDYAYEMISFESSNPDIVGVNQTGLLEAYGSGSARILLQLDGVRKNVFITVSSSLIDDEGTNTPTPDQPDGIPKIVYVESVEELTVPFKTTLSEVISLLPQSVTIRDQNDVEYTVVLDWIVYDYVGDDPRFAPARYIASGLFEIPDGLNPGDFNAQVDTVINLQGFPEIVYIPPVEEITVAFGTPLEDVISRLPEQISIEDENGIEHLVDLNWVVYDYVGNDTRYAPARYAASGLFEVPEDLRIGDLNPQVDTHVNLEGPE